MNNKADSYFSLKGVLKHCLMSANDEAKHIYNLMLIMNAARNEGASEDEIKKMIDGIKLNIYGLFIHIHNDLLKVVGTNPDK